MLLKSNYPLKPNNNMTTQNIFKNICKHLNLIVVYIVSDHWTNYQICTVIFTAVEIKR